MTDARTTDARTTGARADARFRVEFISDAALRDYQGLDGSVRAMVNKGLARLALRADEIGKPLTGALAGCKELKFRSGGIRIIFRITADGHVEIVQIVAIGTRDKGRVFDTATKRIAS